MVFFKCIFDVLPFNLPNRKQLHSERMNPFPTNRRASFFLSLLPRKSLPFGTDKSVPYESSGVFLLSLLPQKSLPFGTDKSVPYKLRGGVRSTYEHIVRFPVQRSLPILAFHVFSSSHLAAGWRNAYDGRRGLSPKLTS